MYPFPGSYNPFGPHAPQPAPAADVPLAQFRAAAERAGASHLSADGKYVYTVRYGETLVAEWDGWERAYGPWSPCGGLPAGAVVIE